MNVSIEAIKTEEFKADALLILEFEDVSALPAAYAPMRDSGELTGKSGEFALIHHAAGYLAHRILMTGAGKREKFTSVELRTAVGAAVRFLKARSLKTAAIALPADLATPENVAAAVEGAILGDFECDQHKSDRSATKFLDVFTILVPDVEPVSHSFRRGRILAESQNFARELANEPPNVLTPLVMAARAKQMAEEQGLECDILDRDKMATLGMGALLGVSIGSAAPPALIVLKYTPASPAAGNAHLAIIGKGVTFDTGGISIKPSEGMEKMKYDMCGGAAAIGAMRAIAQLAPPIPVTAFIPAVENMPGSQAQRPGDIVKSMSGKTIEVLNTDAEGRLILADAITYAISQGCTHLIDAATLTGAVVVALGHHNTGVFTNNDAFLASWMTAAKSEGERMWQMPIEPEYREQLKSAFADIGNIGGRDGGAVTAAMFIKEFVGETPWVHLDIAGTAWLDDAKPHMAKGPTGLPMRSFVALAENWK